jgi:hypothetical protein
MEVAGRSSRAELEGRTSVAYALGLEELGVDPQLLEGDERPDGLYEFRW